MRESRAPGTKPLQRRGGASVDIAADLDRFGVGLYVTGELDASDWIRVATERFDGRFDHEMTFANGERRTLDMDNSDILREDRIVMLDVPGMRRDVARIDMNCHAEHGNMVTMEVLASR